MKKILVIEDDPSSLMLTTEILKKYDYGVVTATDGLTALEIAKEENPDLAIIDVMLPTLNGYQVCECFRKTPQFRNLPIIILTVLNEDSHRIRAIEAGASGFLSKPFKRVELLTRVKALLCQQDDQSDLIPFDTVISALLKALDLRIPKASVSSRRCADLAERLALAMGLSAQQIKEMRWGILLRDMGYLVLPTNMVEVNSLSDKHAGWGSQIVEHFGYELIENIVRYHHCDLLSWDYPKHLEANVLKIIHVVMVCTRLEHLLYNDGILCRSDAYAVMSKETAGGLWPQVEVALILRLLDE